MGTSGGGADRPGEHDPTCYNCPVIRILGPGGILLLALLIYTVLDIIATDEMLIRNLPKITWLIITIIIPIAGIVAWFALGRPIGAGLSPGSTTRAPTRSWMDPEVRDRRPPPRGPEDRDDYRPARGPVEPSRPEPESDAARERRLQEWEAELERREETLDDPDDGDET